MITKPISTLVPYSTNLNSILNNLFTDEEEMGGNSNVILQKDTEKSMDKVSKQ